MIAHRSGSRTTRLALVVTALTVALALTSSGVADADLPQTIKSDVAGNGFVQATSSKLPIDKRLGTMFNQPATEADYDPFPDLKVVLSGLPTKGARLLHCIFLATSASAPYEDGDEDITVQAETLFLLFVAACTQLGLALPISTAAAPSKLSANSTSSPCFKQAKDISIEVTKGGGGYTLNATGMTQTTTAKSPARISCRVQSGGTMITLKPRKKGKTLRKVVGPNLVMGIVNRGTETVGVKTTFDAK